MRPALRRLALGAAHLAVLFAAWALVGAAFDALLGLYRRPSPHTMAWAQLLWAPAHLLPAFLLAAVLPRGDGLLAWPGGEIVARWREVFAAAPAAPAEVAAGVVAAVALVAPGAWLMVAAGGDLPPSVAHLHRSLTQGPLVAQGAITAGALLVAPVVEELMFRGYLWEVLRRVGGAPTAWLVTSALFAAIHGEPERVLGTLPGALLLGWLRLASGSVAPGIVAHFAYNLVAVGALVALGPDLGWLPPWAAALGAVACVVACRVGWRAPRAPLPAG